MRKQLNHKAKRNAASLPGLGPVSTGWREGCSVTEDFQVDS